MKRAALSLLLIGCAEGANFRGQTAAAMAECRNVWRSVAYACQAGQGGLGIALACRARGAEAYDDCMRGKGFEEETP